MINIKQRIGNITARQAGIILGALAILFGIWGYVDQHNTFDISQFLADFYANISAELGSIAITVLIIDTLQHRREERREAEREKEREEREEERKTEELKKRLIREAGRPVRDTAINAVAELRIHG